MAQRNDDRLSEALLSAFDEKGIETLVFDDLKKSVFDLIPYQEFASTVAKVAARDGWTNDLINAALRSKPASLPLLEVALLNPLQQLIEEPPDSSSAGGLEIERGLQALIEMLTRTDLNQAQWLFGELQGHLAALYTEYQRHAATTAE